MADTRKVYALCEPDNPEIVRYVGVTKLPLHRRLASHICPAILARNTSPAAWLRSLMNQGLKPIIRLLEEVPVESWREGEQKWIRYYREQGAALLNISPGGFAVAEESRLRAIATQKRLRPLKRFGGLTSESAKRIQAENRLRGGKRKYNGRESPPTLSPEIRAKMSASAKKRYEDAAERQKNSEFMKKRWANPQIRAQIISGYHKARDKRRDQEKKGA